MWVVVATIVFALGQLALIVVLSVRKRPKYIGKEAEVLRAFEFGVYTVASRRGLTFEPCGLAPSLFGGELTPPQAIGMVGHFAVGVGIEQGEQGRRTYLRFVPQVRLQGWPVVWLVVGPQLRRPPASGTAALTQLRASGYRVHPRHDGLYVVPKTSYWNLSHYSHIETDPARLERVFELALELVYSYPPQPGQGQSAPR